MTKINRPGARLAEGSGRKYDRRILKWDGSHELTIVVDATYSISDMDLVKQDAHLRGANRDI